MIRYQLPPKLIQELPSMLVAHDKVMFTDGTNDLFLFELKPARKGKIYGKGGEGKVPRYEDRVKVTARDYFKGLIGKVKKILV